MHAIRYRNDLRIRIETGIVVNCSSCLALTQAHAYCGGKFDVAATNLLKVFFSSPSVRMTLRLVSRGLDKGMSGQGNVNGVSVAAKYG